MARRASGLYEYRFAGDGLCGGDAYSATPLSLMLPVSDEDVVGDGVPGVVNADEEQ